MDDDGVVRTRSGAGPGAGRASVRQTRRDPLKRRARTLMSDLCQSCGACCATSAEWPRFSLESEEAIAAIPAAYVDDPQGRMRCEGDRCTALKGKIGEATACLVYAVRPEVPRVSAGRSGVPHRARQARPACAQPFNALIAASAAAMPVRYAPCAVEKSAGEVCSPAKNKRSSTLCAIAARGLRRQRRRRSRSRATTDRAPRRTR